MLDPCGSSTCTISAEAFPHVKLKRNENGVYAGFEKEKGVYHATLTLKCCKTERLALFRQLVEVMLYALRGKFPIFHDTVRVQDAVFESGQERPAVVGHRVVVSKAGLPDCSGHRAERSSHRFSFPRFLADAFGCLTVTTIVPESNVSVNACSLDIPCVRRT